jgi:hypothetical protein
MKPGDRRTNAITYALSCDENAFCVEAIEYVAEALSRLPDQVLCGHHEIIDKEFVGLVIHHRLDGVDLRDNAKGLSVRQGTRKGRLCAEWLPEPAMCERATSQIGVLKSGGEDLLASHHIMATCEHGSGSDIRGVAPSRRFCNCKCLEAQVASCDRGQITRLLSLRAGLEQHTHHIQLRVYGGSIRLRSVHLLEDYRRFGNAQAQPAVLRWDQRSK